MNTNSVSYIFSKDALFDLGVAMSNIDFNTCDIKAFCEDFNIYTSLIPVSTGMKITKDGSISLFDGKTASNKYIRILNGKKVMPCTIQQHLFSTGKYLVSQYAPPKEVKAETYTNNEVLKALQSLNLEKFGFGRGTKCRIDIIVLPDITTKDCLTEIFLPYEENHKYYVIVHKGNCESSIERLSRALASAIAVATIDTYALEHVAGWHIITNKLKKHQIKDLNTMDYQTSILVRSSAMTKKYESLGVGYNPIYKAFAFSLCKCNDSSIVRQKNKRAIRSIEECINEIVAESISSRYQRPS